MIQIWNTRYKFESPPGLPNKKSVQIDLAICFVYDPLWWGVNKKKKQKNKKNKKTKVQEVECGYGQAWSDPGKGQVTGCCKYCN